MDWWRVCTVIAFALFGIFVQLEGILTFRVFEMNILMQPSAFWTNTNISWGGLILSLIFKEFIVIVQLPIQGNSSI